MHYNEEQDEAKWSQAFASIILHHRDRSLHKNLLLEGACDNYLCFIAVSAAKNFLLGILSLKIA